MSLMRKSAFAAQCGVHRSRVSHWIRDKKLDGAAIVGVGRSAMIDAVEAGRQLRLRLDSDQMCGLNGLNTNLSGKPRPVKVARPAVNLLEEITIFEAAGWRIARALVSAGWPTTERKAWDTLMEGLNRLDEQQLDAKWAAEAA